MPLGALVVIASVLGAAETDQYYSWRVEVGDGAAAFNERVRADLAQRLAAVNARGDVDTLTCNDVVHELLLPYWPTGMWFVIGATKGWGFPYRPANASERVLSFNPASIYHVYGLLPLGVFVPVDPTMRVGDVYFGTDKISHFVHNSVRFWDSYVEARAQGKSRADAEIAALDRGIAQEAGVLGSMVASSFSFADVEVSYQGLRMIEGWCEDGGLVREDHRWRFTRTFDVHEWVSPCWDESWYNNAYPGLTGDGVRMALHDYCALRDTPRVKERLRKYRALGCHGAAVDYLDALVRKGELPDPSPYSIDVVCGDRPARAIPPAPTMRSGACFP